MNLLNAVESTKEVKSKRGKDALVIGIQDAVFRKSSYQNFRSCFTTKKRRRHGLGLYLVKELADRLSIAIDVRSEVGRGTEVLLGLGSISDMRTGRTKENENEKLCAGIDC